MNYFVTKMKQVICRTKIGVSKKLFLFAFIWWRNWSKVYRRLHHKRYNYVTLERELSLTKVQEKLAKLKYTPDGLKELWDACGSPKRVQYILDEMAKGRPQPLGAMDCDDFSCWAANVIDRNFHPRILCFSWVDPETCEIRSHAVCLLRQPDGRLFHISNWGTSKPLNNLREVCVNMLNKSNSEESIGWCLMRKDMAIIEWGLELPSGSVN